jgi:hypothetical protein
MRDIKRNTLQEIKLCLGCNSFQENVELVEAGSLSHPIRVPLCPTCRARRDTRAQAKGYQDYAGMRQVFQSGENSRQR